MLARENGRKRRLDTETAFNMTADPDNDLEIDSTAGVSGEAFVHRLAAYGDLAWPFNRAVRHGACTTQSVQKCAAASIRF